MDSSTVRNLQGETVSSLLSVLSLADDSSLLLLGPRKRHENRGSPQQTSFFSNHAHLYRQHAYRQVGGIFADGWRRKKSHFNIPYLVLLFSVIEVFVCLLASPTGDLKGIFSLPSSSSVLSQERSASSVRTAAAGAALNFHLRKHRRCVRLFLFTKAVEASPRLFVFPLLLSLAELC